MGGREGDGLRGERGRDRGGGERGLAPPDFSDPLPVLRSPFPYLQRTDFPEEAASRLLCGLPLASEPLGLITLQDVMAQLLQEEVIEEDRLEGLLEEDEGEQEEEEEEERQGPIPAPSGWNEEDGGEKSLGLGRQTRPEGAPEGCPRGKDARGGRQEEDGEMQVVGFTRHGSSIALLNTSQTMVSSSSSTWEPRQLATARSLFNVSASPEPVIASLSSCRPSKEKSTGKKDIDVASYSEKNQEVEDKNLQQTSKKWIPFWGNRMDNRGAGARKKEAEKGGAREKAQGHDQGKGGRRGAREDQSLTMELSSL